MAAPYLWLVIAYRIETHFIRSDKKIEVGRATFTNKVEAMRYCQEQRAKGLKANIEKWFGE